MRLEFGVMPEDQVVPCCAAAVYSAGERCDCWVVELRGAQEPIQQGPVNVRRRACEDCAYRTDSVERARGEEPNPGGGLIFCHWGAPEVARAIHTPTGHVIEYGPGEVYDPIEGGGLYWKLDGAPQDYCAVSGALTGARRTRVPESHSSEPGARN